MQRGQMFRPNPGKNRGGILPPGKWQKETSSTRGQTAPETGTKKEIRRHRDTAGEGGERTNSTRRQSLTEPSPGIAG